MHLACTNHTKPVPKKVRAGTALKYQLRPWFSTPLGRNLGRFQNLPHHRPKCRPIKSADRVLASVFLDQSPHFTGEDSRKVRWFFPRIFSRVILRNLPTVSNIRTSQGLILSADGKITSSQHVWTACLPYSHPALLHADRVCLVLKGLCYRQRWAT